MTSSRFSPCSLLLALAFAQSIHATDAVPPVDQRLVRIEEQLAQLEARLNGMPSTEDLEPTRRELSEVSRFLGRDGTSPATLVRAQGKEKTLSIGGFVQAQAEFGGTPDARYTGIHNRVLLRRARPNVKGTFGENFDFKVEGDVGNNSIGGIAGYRAQVTDLFVNWNKYAVANVQIGQFKTPFGLEQLTSDTKTLTVERSLPNDQLTVGRQIGIGVGGTFLNKSATYSLGAFNGAGVNNGANDNDQFMYAGRVAVTLWSRGANKIALATNGYVSRDTGTFTGRRTGTGIDTQATFGALDFAAEYLSVLQNRVIGTDTTAHGWYAQGAYYVVPKTLQGVVRYESHDSNKNTRDTTTLSWVIGANYYIKGDDLKLVFNYTVGNPAGPLGREGRFGARIQVIY